VGVFLGLKTLQAVSLVQGDKNPVSIRNAPPSASDEILLAQIADRDSLLVDTGSLDRDPFRDPTVWRPQRVRTSQPERDKEVVPILRALLYDNVNPSVQLSAGSETSDWLRQGDSFKDWVIVEIGPDSVRISKNDEHVVLSTS
jgi:hypothetical protein